MRIREEYERQALLDSRYNEDRLYWASDDEEYTDEMRAEDDRAREVKEEILDLYCEWNPRADMYEVRNWDKWGFINYANVDYIRADPVLDEALDCTKAHGCYGARCYLASLEFSLEDLEHIRDTLKELAAYPILDEVLYYSYYNPAWDEEFEDWACTIRKAPWFDEGYARENAEIIDEGEGYVCFTNGDELIEEMKRRYAS